MNGSQVVAETARKIREKSSRNTGILAALSSALFLGFTPIFGKHALLAGFSPLALVTLRTAIAAGMLFVSMLILHRKFFYIYPVGLIGCALAGLFNGLGSILYYSALNRLDASIAHLIYSFYPIFLAVWQMLDSQPVNRITFIRLGVAIPGVYLLVATGSQSADLPGALLMIGSAILYALHILINQRVLLEVPAPTVTFYTLLSMTVTVATAFLLFNRQFPPGGTPWWPVLGMAAITFFSRITLFLGVKHLGGMQTTLLGLGELIITVSVAAIWLGERLSPLQWIGALLISCSMLLIGFDHYTPQKRRSTGWLAWLNPPAVNATDLTWPTEP
ncbi:MAG: DMT family transporter [Chloroflexi bacterium]|nr:DMT family transporter [Chloroflexota bacterium]